jgi:hypothetical protein
MGDGDVQAPRNSAVYREFARLYRIARSLQPTNVDRWSGNLLATSDQLNWDSFVPKTGDLRMSDRLVLHHLTGSAETTHRQRAQALATVLHEATHTGMATDAPTEPNAVRSPQTRGLMEGFAEFRTVNNFDLFSAYAGYPGLELRTPQYPGAYAAVKNLVNQVSGPAKDRQAFIAQGIVGPAAMHFDQLADSAVRNRLAEVVPARAKDQQAIRAALIETMMHPGWPSLPEGSPRAGELVAEDIRPRLNAKVDEIRRHYRTDPDHPFPADSPNQYAVRLATGNRPEPPAHHAAPPTEANRQHVDTMRFLSGQLPAAYATRPGPPLGNGSRVTGAPTVPRTITPNRGRT